MQCDARHHISPTLGSSSPTETDPLRHLGVSTWQCRAVREGKKPKGGIALPNAMRAQSMLKHSFFNFTDHGGSAVALQEEYRTMLRLAGAM